MEYQNKKVPAKENIERTTYLLQLETALSRCQADKRILENTIADLVKEVSLLRIKLAQAGGVK